MRQVSIIFLLTALILVLNPQMAISAIKGGIEYSIPVDYSKLSEEEIEKKALYYYELAKRLPDDTVNEDMTNALFHYSILHQMSTGNPEYYVRLGFLYDKLHKDKMAKSCFTPQLTKSEAKRYIEEALKQSPNPELENQIKRIEAFDQQNKEYYLDTRIRG